MTSREGEALISAAIAHSIRERELTPCVVPVSEVCHTCDFAPLQAMTQEPAVGLVRGRWMVVDVLVDTSVRHIVVGL